MTDICMPKKPCSMPKRSFTFSRGAQVLTVVALSLTASLVARQFIDYPSDVDVSSLIVDSIFSSGFSVNGAIWGLASSSAFLIPRGASVKKAAAIISASCIIGGGLGFGIIQALTQPRATLDFLSGSAKTLDRPAGVTAVIDGKTYTCRPQSYGKMICE